MPTVLSKALRDLSETEFDALLFRNRDAVARTLGWGSYHTLRSKGSKAGYPDRTLWRDRVIFAELKGEKGKPTPLQVENLDGLAKAGGEVYLWRPSDLDEIAKILGRRWTLEPAETIGPSPNLTATHFPPRLTAREYGSWTPGSLWIPGEGRFDASTA